MGENMNRYHCCATCVNFEINKTGGVIKYHCSRLGYETKPTYQFQCWEPKEQVVKLMKKRK